jgi:hypothetical protein
MRLRTLPFLLALASAQSFAWFDTGHMVVAEIAYRHLDPQVRQEARRLLSLSNDLRTNDFRTCACWADDVKSRENGHWHYTNLYFRLDGKEAKGKPLEENVVWAIERFTRVVGDRSKSDAERLDALRFLNHFVGDIHQPLHATALETDELPNGDRGGNEFKILPPQGLNPIPRNLHFLWDSGAGLFAEQVRPLNEQGQRAIARYADEAIEAYPYAKFKADKKSSRPSDWAKESFELAKKVVYSDIRMNEEPSREYLQRARSVAQRRVAEAGYRLAELLNAALKR